MSGDLDRCAAYRERPRRLDVTDAAGLEYAVLEAGGVEYAVLECRCGRRWQYVAGDLEPGPPPSDPPVALRSDLLRTQARLLALEERLERLEG